MHCSGEESNDNELSEKRILRRSSLAGAFEEQAVRMLQRRTSADAEAVGDRAQDSACFMNCAF